MSIHFQSLNRNKRCVLAYLYVGLRQHCFQTLSVRSQHRAGKIKEQWWQTGITLPAEAKSNLGASEHSFLQGEHPQRDDAFSRSACPC
jgi:hypothetical protein